DAETRRVSADPIGLAAAAPDHGQGRGRRLPGPRPSSRSFLPRRSLPGSTAAAVSQAQIATSVTRGWLAQQMRVARMAWPDVLVEGIGVLYLKFAPPDRPSCGRARLIGGASACGRPACRRSIDQGFD